MKIEPQGWVILKCKQVGDFEVQIDSHGDCLRTRRAFAPTDFNLRLPPGRLSVSLAFDPENMSSAALIVIDPQKGFFISRWHFRT